MTWQDDYQDASFRAVPFSVRTNSVTGGRRIVTHQYPRSDINEHEDVGREDKIFSVDGYIVGTNAWERWKDLETALEQNGPGLLVHPYRGSRNVVVAKYNATDVSSKGRYVSFTFEARLEPEQEITVAADTEEQLQQARNALDDAAGAWLEDNYNLAGKPYNAIQDVRDTIGKALDGLEAAKRSAASAAAFKRAVDSAKGKVIAISLNAQAIANTYKDVANYFIDTALAILTKKDQAREMRQVYNVATQKLVPTTDAVYDDDTYPSKQTQAHLSYTAVASMVGLIPQIEYGSVSEAEQEQEELFSRIDDLSEQSILSSEVYAALRTCRSAVYNYLEERAIDLPYLIDYESKQEDNALSLSYKLYGNIETAETIASVNELIHPGFIPNGQVLVLKAE